MGALKQIFETSYEKLKKNSKDVKQLVESILQLIEKSTI
jgi:hypothetical protein